MDLNLRGKLALVTGASKGIGLACARQLAEEGCHLHLASRTKADLERAKESIQARHNVSVTIHPVDLSNGDTARSLAAACRVNPWNFMTLPPRGLSGYFPRPPRPAPENAVGPERFGDARLRLDGKNEATAAMVDLLTAVADISAPRGRLRKV